MRTACISFLKHMSVNASCCALGDMSVPPASCGSPGAVCLVLEPFNIITHGAYVQQVSSVVEDYFECMAACEGCPFSQSEAENAAETPYAQTMRSFDTCFSICTNRTGDEVTGHWL